MRENIPKSLVTAFMVFVVIVLIGVFSYNYYSSRVARKYLTDLQTSSLNLQSTLSKLADTVNSPVFDDPSNHQVSKKNLQQIEQSISSTRTQLANYQQSAKNLPVLKLAGSFGEYKKAKVKQKLATNIVSQTQDVLNDYKTTTDYLLALKFAVK